MNLHYISNRIAITRTLPAAEDFFLIFLLHCGFFAFQHDEKKTSCAHVLKLEFGENIYVFTENSISIDKISDM